MPHHLNSWVLVYTQHATVGSMKKGKIVGFNAAKMAEQMMANAVAEQNRRLVEYAEQRIIILGETISSWNSRHHMDDTGNLLDSLCWGVCYDGKMVESGFYRPQKATTPSYLHGWSTVEFADPKRFKRHAVGESVKNWVKMDAGEPVNGHDLAAAYLQQAPKKCKSGEWMVFFAILAPYWGYWEKGFEMKTGGGLSFFSARSRFLQFSVMSQFYDIVKSNLKPARTRIKVYVPKYASRSLMSRARKNLNG